jgi:hypothetical protein
MHMAYFLILFIYLFFKYRSRQIRLPSIIIFNYYNNEYLFPKALFGLSFYALSFEPDNDVAIDQFRFRNTAVLTDYRLI